MKEELIKFETAKLAKKKGFNIPVKKAYKVYNGYSDMKVNSFKIGKCDHNSLNGNCYNTSAPRQSLLQKFIREKRGVHIEIHRNGSGYYWSMCKEDSGTDLGWSDHKGPNLGGVWDKFEEALEDAMFVQLSYDLTDNTKIFKHWGNYVQFAIESLK